MSFLRSRWFAPTLHVFLFATMCLGTSFQSQPLLDGPAPRWGFFVLFFADLPISVIGFSMMWDGKWNEGLLLWGVLGTAWWYLIGLLIRQLQRSIKSQ
jgi:hypothetical protein